MRILFVVYDNDSYIHYFPMGIAYLAAALEKEFFVDIFFQDFHHYPDSYLTQYLDEHDFDIVCLSFIGGYYQYRKALKLAAAINTAKQRPFFVLGGHGPAPEPEFFMKKTGADAVCIGEGEETLLELARALANKDTLEKIQGIAYRDGNSFIINERRPVIKDIDKIEFPAYHLFPMHYYRLFRGALSAPADFTIQMLSGRGCPFHCNFCYRMDEGFRPRSNESIVEEIQFLQKNYGITYICFFDELLMSSEQRVESFCNYLLSKKVHIKWEASGRLNYAKPDLLKLMHSTGCVFVNYGIECFDDNILKGMNKALTTSQITKGVEATLAAGISPGLNVIFGNHGESRDTLKKSVDFLLRYDDGAQLRTIRPVTPYPGSELYYDAIRMGKLKDCEDFYENKHINSDLLTVNFTNLSDDEYYHALFWANDTLLKHYDSRLRQQRETILHRLYIERNPEFRGFRTV